ncbi:esterase [Mycobacterium colombiense]|uniref:alpha/beta fold hydrolase n=1 Tax=Mycobacterium colombiense TaxID=339268 RepID=UPI0007EFC1C4|nr:alpha/beta hydrolase [Mycobacterium colombiense]OBK68929.1 esterase [Mycobacterium colombiense]
MSLPDLVLVHGGTHAADCWDPTVAELQKQAPELRVLAIDLPCRRHKPGNLATATIAEWVDSAVADIDAAELGDVVIAGHSMAGVTVPGIVTKLGSSRVREMILITAFVPPQGASVVQTLTGPMAWFARRFARAGKSARLPKAVTSIAFCNGMTREQRRFTLACSYDESMAIASEPVDRESLPREVPRTWIMTTRDRTLPVRTQHKSIAALGGVDVTLNIDACHDVMISNPETLAGMLIERCRKRQ